MVRFSVDERRLAYVPPVTMYVHEQGASLLTLFHEIAHCVVGPEAGHGEEFRRRHVEILGGVLGADNGELLEWCYREALEPW